MATQPQVLCPVLATEQHNIVTSDNLDSLYVSTYQRTPGTVVNVTCYVDTSYRLQGSSRLICNDTGVWDPEVPTCVRRDALPKSDYSNGIITTDLSNPLTFDPSDIALTAIACACAIILLVVIIILIFKFCCLQKIQTRPKHGRWKSFHNMEDNNMKDRQNLPPPSSLGSLRTQRTLQWTWPGNSRAWTYLSVDRLLRDMERSRRENPNHSWRDFATMTTSDSSAEALNWPRPHNSPSSHNKQASSYSHQLGNQRSPSRLSSSQILTDHASSQPWAH